MIRRPVSGKTATSNACTHRQWRSIRVRVLRRDRYTCQYCGDPANTVDHVKPRSHGGGDELTNLVACCVRCQVADRSQSVRDVKGSLAVRNTVFKRGGRLEMPPSSDYLPQTSSGPVTRSYRRA